MNIKAFLLAALVWAAAFASASDPALAKPFRLLQDPPPVRISIAAALIDGELHTGFAGRLNTLYNVLGKGFDLDVGTFVVTNPRDGIPVVGFDLTYAFRLADNARMYLGPALRWEQGQRSTVGLSFGVTVEVADGGE